MFFISKPLFFKTKEKSSLPNKLRCLDSYEGLYTKYCANEKQNSALKPKTIQFHHLTN